MTDFWSKKRDAVLDQVQEVRDFANRPQVKRMLSLGVEMFNAVQPVIDKPSWWTVGRSIASVSKVLVTGMEVDADAFFGTDDWTLPFSNDFSTTILKVLHKMPHKVMKTSEEGIQIRTVELGNGVMAGWSHNTKFNSAYHVYVQTERLAEARKLIKDMLWKQFSGDSLVMRMNHRGFGASRDEARVIFEVDDTFLTLPSENSVKYTAYLNRCLEAGVSRSLMLYGPPGTGKSTLARTLVKDLSLRSFRVRIEDVSSFDSGTLFEAIQIFEPDAVILDDLDRARGQASLLEVLEFFQNRVKLVVATVNDRDELDEALLRPGRFDELVEVDRMDEGVVKHVLGERFADGFETVKAWPIAFIHEYVKRRRFMTEAEAATATVELADRVRRLQSYRAEDDLSRMSAAVAKPKKKKKSKSKRKKKAELLVEEMMDQLKDSTDTDP